MKTLGLVLAALGAALVLVAVAVLTVGRVAVVSTVGNSMEPGFHAGDLALLIPARDYRVGDVAGYHSDDLDTVVMHRIVDVADDGYVLQGDNNDWLDPEHPTEDQFVGKLALRVPQGGVWLERVTSPPALAVVAFGLVAGGGAVETRRRRRRGPVGEPEDAPPRRRRPRQSEPATAPQTRPADPTTVGVATAAGVALLAGVLVGLATFRDLPGTTSDLAYTHEGSFSYTADAPRGPVYPEGSVETGETVFLQVVDDIDVTFDWRLVPPPGQEVDVAGTGQLLLEVADGSGWQRTIPLAEPQEIEGPEATLQAPVDLSEIQRLVASVQRATGATGTSQTLTLTAELDLAGTVAGEPIDDELGPAVTFTLDPLRLQPPVGEGDSDALAVSEPRTVSVPGAAGTTLDVLGRSIPVSTVRVVAVALVVLSLLLAGAWFLLRRREQSRTVEEDIQARHGQVVIDTAGMAPATGRTLVEVTSIDALVRLGEKLQQPVLRVPMLEGGTSYVVDDGYTIYRHRPATR